MKGKAGLVDILVHQSHNAGLVRPRRVVRSPEQDLPDDVGPLGSSENLFSLLDDVPEQFSLGQQSGMEQSHLSSESIDIPAEKKSGSGGINLVS